MKKTALWIKGITSVNLGFLWSYSLLTRIGLFSLLPLWVKAVLWSFSTLAFSLLSFYFINLWKKSFKNKKLILYQTVLSIILTGLIFIFLPYERIAFRTTHHLTIQTFDSYIEINGVYSPDENLINPNDFSLEGNVEFFDETGFILTGDSKISFTDFFTGGLTIAFSQVDGAIEITWDNEIYSFQTSTIESFSFQAPDDWNLRYEAGLGQSKLSLPGNTWGNPDMLWSILGFLMPIADFITFASLLISFYWIASKILKKEADLNRSKKLFFAWFGFLISLLLIRFGISTFIPDISSWLSIIICLPPIVYLICLQTLIILKGLDLEPQILGKVHSGIDRIISTLTMLNQNKILAWVLLLIIALIGTAFLFKLTQPGMGASGDSVHYIDGAINLSKGLGYVRNILVGAPQPITGFPPGYPASLIPGILLGLSAENSARILNLLLYFFFILILGGIILKFSKRVLPAILVSLFAAMFVSMESIFAWIMSEPIFILIMLVLLLLCYRLLDKPNFWLFIILALLSSFNILVRLAGLSLVGAIAIIILFHKKGKLVNRFGVAFIYGIISLIPFLLFLYRNSRIADSISESRGLNWAVFKPEYWEIIFREISTWFKIDSFFRSDFGIFFTLGVIILGVFLIYFFNRLKERNSEQYKRIFEFLDLLSALILIYVIMIVLNVIVFTPGQTIPGLTRYTLPLFPIFLIYSTIIFTKFIWPKVPYPVKITFAIILIMIVRMYISDYLQFNNNVPKHFRAYTDIISECDDHLDVFYSFPKTSEIYSNNCEFIYYASGLSCNYLPLDSESYQDESELFKSIQEGNIVAVMNEYGSTANNINSLIKHLKPINFQCMITFYEWDH